MMKDAVQVGVSPSDFWRMTPKELHFVMEGYLWRRDDLHIHLSRYTAAIISPHTKKRIKPKDLYDPVLIGKERGPSLEERKAKFQEIQRMMRAKGG